ncbi:MAG: hypothetical protein BGP03_16715 [Pseudonocardia sp. 73-21]|nr:MAG: hypothetical protein BGP03_16715 [Pseudonocardia sp. 73-21]
MACSHTAECPLFPLLNASLDGWRRCYCDSADGWRECARYKQSLRGQYVPLNLLPNGHEASLQSAVAGRGPGPGGPHGARTPGGAPTLVDLLFEHAPSSDRLQPEDECPPAPTPRSVDEPVPTRPWWKRLAEWMRSPS